MFFWWLEAAVVHQTEVRVEAVEGSVNFHLNQLQQLRIQSPSVEAVQRPGHGALVVDLEETLSSAGYFLLVEVEPISFMVVQKRLVVPVVGHGIPRAQQETLVATAR
jgi:hypothetical protein